MGELGAVAYRGPSLLTGEPIVAVLTGLEGASRNPKTGPMVQVWILRPDAPPHDVIRAGLDDAICGDCKYRGAGSLDRRCYVATWLGPTNVWKAFARGDYLDASWAELQALVEGRHLRISAYGDPAAVPFDLWRTLLVTAAGWTAYTHQWKRCDPRLKTIAMASVDDLDEFHAAQILGWRTFRVRTDAPLTDAEVTCPASEEAGHRTTCDRCELCRGQANRAKSVVIHAHGHNGVMTAFYRSRSEATA